MHLFKTRAACALFAAVALTVAWGAHRSRTPRHRRGPLERISDRLEEKGLHFHVVAASADRDLGQGFYLCATPAPRGALEALPHTPEALLRWKGVVFVGRYYPVHEEEVLGGGTAVIDRCRLFGDPEMVARVCNALGAKTADHVP